MLVFGKSIFLLICVIVASYSKITSLVRAVIMPDLPVTLELLESSLDQNLSLAVGQIAELSCSLSFFSAKYDELLTKVANLETEKNSITKENSCLKASILHYPMSWFKPKMKWMTSNNTRGGIA